MLKLNINESANQFTYASLLDRGKQKTETEDYVIDFSKSPFGVKYVYCTGQNGATKKSNM